MRNFSVSLVNTRSAKESKTKLSAVEGQTGSAIEIDLETPDQSVDEVERKTTESTPMPNAEEQEKKTIEFSPIDIVDDTTSSTPETMKDDSQTKITSFTERIAMMVGMKPREKEEIAPTTEKGKTFGTVSAITTEDNRDDDQVELVAKESKTKLSAVEGQTGSAIEIDLETPDQSVDEVERKTTESTPMPNAEEQEKKTIEFSPIDIVDDTTSSTPETMKDDSQTKITSFTERIAMMVGMKPREKEEIAPTTEKGKTFGTVSAITTEDNRDDDQVELVATANHEATVNNGATANQEKTTSPELGDLMAKLEQIDKKLTYSEEDRQMLKRRYDIIRARAWTIASIWRGQLKRSYSKCQTR